ncbi:MAG: ornithine cyclodeaminase family protein [Arhodomonas sp.]|nr:ornithine cyclodeaminase family protein [Arhodomonas sp.]
MAWRSRRNGAADVKAAYVSGWDSFAVELSTRFFDNPARGLSSGSGLMAVLDSDTGRPRALLLDDGYLTTVRTALAGALAAKHLARESLTTVGVIGTGSQARWQLIALALVRDFERVLVHGRNPEAAAEYAERMSAELGLPVEVATDARSLVRASDLVVTTTPATEPVIDAEWLHPGLHITAMGSDAAHKNELAPAVLGAADVLACDLKSQCELRGELRHAIAAGVIPASEPVTELGSLVNGRASGRRGDDDITVCDLTGVGVQDIAIARYAMGRVQARGLGTELG